jgi:thymidine kinase
VIAPDDDSLSERQQRQGSRGDRSKRERLLVDEAQFLSETVVDDLLRIAIIEEFRCYHGIRTDFQTGGSFLEAAACLRSRICLRS